ncbi:MAG: CotH kinase family protein [Oscillospiraceae bacterium]|nr:CotH kinase family protein [Oscillospiraceae bacterium]
MKAKRAILLIMSLALLLSACAPATAEVILDGGEAHITGSQSTREPDETGEDPLVVTAPEVPEREPRDEEPSVPSDLPVRVIENEISGTKTFDAVPMGTIPIISVNTGGKEVVSKTQYVNCTVSVYGAGTAWDFADAAAGIKVRGNQSAFYGNVEKIRQNPVPYRIKFEKKHSMLGLNGGSAMKSWVLLKNVEDVVRNAVAFRLGRYIMGPDNYCSDAILVRLELNGDFMGLYLLCEQTQVNEHRVDVNEPEEGDKDPLTGYLVELDNYGEEPYFKMDYGGAEFKDLAGTKRKFKAAKYSIKSDVWSQEQESFIAEYVRNCFNALLKDAAGGKQAVNAKGTYESKAATSREAVEEFLDLDSFVNMFILYTIVDDKDVGAGSFFFAVDFTDPEPRLRCTAPWDFNWTCMGPATDSLYVPYFQPQSFVDSYGDRSNPWFLVLCTTDWFRKAVARRWEELGGLEGITEIVNEEKALFDAVKKEVKSVDQRLSTGSGGAFSWLGRRLPYLDKEFGKWGK